jgi:NAD(P)-dependent dehydrogenase (short-subunit alcohol dehydrogenase family)
MNKIVCISGCSRGLGEALAIEFSNRGWRVAGGARTSDSLDKLGHFLSTDNHLQMVDVTIPEQVDSFSRQVIEKLGCPDLLINNAGIINANARLKDVSPEEFAEVLSTNLGGIHNMIRAFLPAMEKKGEGIIVNFSSYWGKSAAPEVGPYCASKWGVEGLTRSLAQELPGGLSAVALNPGIINTDMLRSCFGEGASSYESPATWAKKATDCLTRLGPSDNGETILP